jgi:hypothetical protein
MRARQTRCYDYRLRSLVNSTGDIAVALDLGVPRSTAAGWVRSPPPPVVSLNVLDRSVIELQQEVLRLRRRLEVVTALYRLLLALVRVVGARLDRRRIADDCSKAFLLRVIDRSRSALPLRSVLRVLGLSSSRYHSWSRALSTCGVDDAVCPRTSPQQLTAQEILMIREMVTAPEYRHVPTGRLALWAQRLGKVVASPSTWYRLIREHRWRRPRQRLHPRKPKVGLRTSTASLKLV